MHSQYFMYPYYCYWQNEQKTNKEVIYECPDCEHKNVNPDPDDEGDRVCEECGCILPEKMKYICDVCEHENIDPEQNSDGDYICENCGSALDVEVRRKIQFGRLYRIFLK